ncbi:hydroxymethylbilane synthase, partial [Pseudomonas syringae]|nr:hydroxymethylbilane synthase [Pseudomonas syringae]
MSCYYPSHSLSTDCSMSSREIRIATRKSALALWQAEYVKARRE